MLISISIMQNQLYSCILSRYLIQWLIRINWNEEYDFLPAIMQYYEKDKDVSILHIHFSGFVYLYVCIVLCIGRIWWKLEYHNFILKMYFSGRAYHVVLITDQLWIKWHFWKNVIFCPKTTFLGKKWLFDLLPSSA